MFVGVGVGELFTSGQAERGFPSNSDSGTYNYKRNEKAAGNPKEN